MTKWKIPIRHLQSWLIRTKSARNNTGIMPQKFDFLALDYKGFGSERAYF